MKPQASSKYLELIEKARWSHENGRRVFHIKPEDVQLARLFSYAYRTQTIGAFHACRVALEAHASEAGSINFDRTFWLLKQLENAAIMPVPSDFRTVISTLYLYDVYLRELTQEMEKVCLKSHKPGIELIKERFVAHVEKITNSWGICPLSDIVTPEQCGYVVPGLGITVLPLSYANHLSWNVACLPAESFGVSPHLHFKGVEIHLGFSPTDGRTILGDGWAEVHEGYAMPIPTRTVHGFENLSGHLHLLPFIFGSLCLDGWGVFFDVEPCPIDTCNLAPVQLDSVEMNHSVYLDREIQRIAKQTKTQRDLLIPASATRIQDVGGLDLWICCVGPEGLELTSPGDRILSVRLGSATIQIGPVRAELAEHDHVCIPSGLEAQIHPMGPTPLVILDASIS